MCLQGFVNILLHINEMYVCQSGQSTLRAETVHLFCQFNAQSQLEYSKAQERRRQLKEDRGRLIQEEVEKMERDLAQELVR